MKNLVLLTATLTLYGQIFNKTIDKAAGSVSFVNQLTAMSSKISRRRKPKTKK